MSKICKRCGKEKELNEFCKAKSYKDGYSNLCKECRNEISLERGVTRKRAVKLSDKETRVCTHCGVELPIEMFSITNKQYGWRHSWCNKCRNRHQTQKRVSNGTERSRKLKSRFGITMDEYSAMLVAQDFKCPICGVSVSDCTKNLSVDHNHETGKIIGLLCDKCNLALGLFKDNKDSLRGAILYLEKHGG